MTRVLKNRVGSRSKNTNSYMLSLSHGRMGHKAWSGSGVNDLGRAFSGRLATHHSETTRPYGAA